jgi:hypothetical protein
MINKELRENIVQQDKLQQNLIDAHRALSDTSILEIAAGENKQDLRRIVLLTALAKSRLQIKLNDIEIEIRAIRNSELHMLQVQRMLKIEQDIIHQSLQDFEIKVGSEQFTTWQATYNQKYGPGLFFRPT